MRNNDLHDNTKNKDRALIKKQHFYNEWKDDGTLDAHYKDNLHELYHHYLKIVLTWVNGLSGGRQDLRVFLILPHLQLALYQTDMVPEAKFGYDSSPIKHNVQWYNYCTSIMAVIGGVFTVVGMIESSFLQAVNSAQTRRQKSTFASDGRKVKNNCYACAIFSTNRWLYTME